MYVYLYPHLCVYISLKFKLFFIFPQILTVFQQMQFVEGFLKWKKKINKSTIHNKKASSEVLVI